MKLLLIALGGAAGTIARYLLAGAVHRYASPYFPFGTFAVNVVGCLAFGIVAGLAEYRNVVRGDTRTWVLVGVLGGFTTFSSFTYETYELLRDAQFARAALNSMGQVLVGLIALWAGYTLAKII